MNIEKVGVIGAGQMGHGIAQVFAAAGYTVILNDIAEEFVQKGLAGIAKNLDRAVGKGKLSKEDRDATLARVAGSTSLEDFSDVDLVVEAACEGRSAVL